MGLLGFLKVRVFSGGASSVSPSRVNNVFTAISVQTGLALPVKGLSAEAILLSPYPSASMFSAFRHRIFRALKDHVRAAFVESRPARESKSTHWSPSTEPDTFVLAISGYRLFKILKNHVKGALTETSPTYPAYRQSKLPSDGRCIAGLTSWYVHPFRAIEKHAFRAVGQSTNACRYSAHSFKALEGPAHSFRFSRHTENSSKYLRHTFRGGKHPVAIFQHNQRCYNAIWHSRNFARLYAPAHRPVGQLKAATSGNAGNLKGICWSRLWRTVWQRLVAKPQANMSILPPLGMMLKAVSLACTRSHLPWGIMAIILGSMNHSIAQAQGNTNSFQNSPSSVVLSSLFSLYELFGLIARSLYLWVLFMPAVLIAPFANMCGGYFRQSWLRLVHRTLEFAGAAFIKWGQWAATRPDLFPRDLCLELTKLHANAPAHKFSHTVQTIQRAFGKMLTDIFVEFEEMPVASGSIAQVHKATLRHGGSSGRHQGPMTVAVKVRHPGVTDVIRRDFIIINWVANLSTLIPGLKWLRLDESVRQFAVFMLTQVDLAREAAHLSRFLYNFRSWRDVSFPRPVYPLVHPAVLVESYEQGESVSHYLALSEKSKLNRRLAHIGTHTFLKMLLVDNFIHADMHPGNILVRVKKKTFEEERKKASIRRSQPHLVFLDVGLTAELSQKDRSNLLEFFKAVALRDGRTAAQCALEFSNNQSCPDPPTFIKELETSFKFWGSREADVIHPGECMQELLEQVRRHRVNVDGNVCTVMVTIMVLEGWQRKLDPDFNIMNTLQKLLFKQDWAESLAYTINGIMAP